MQFAITDIELHDETAYRTATQRTTLEVDLSHPLPINTSSLRQQLSNLKLL
jgi:hypothetical protein